MAKQKKQLSLEEAKANEELQAPLPDDTNEYFWCGVCFKHVPVSTMSGHNNVHLDWLAGITYGCKACNESKPIEKWNSFSRSAYAKDHIKASHRHHQDDDLVQIL